VRFPPANVQLRRAQLVLMLATLVPTVLIAVIGIILLVTGSESATMVVGGILVIVLCTSAITGYILGALFVGKGASLARVQNDFLSSVSHELRTPLTAIRLFLEGLRDDRLDPAEKKKVLELLGIEVERLDYLVLRVLEVSKMESGRHPFERELVRVEEIARDAIAAFDVASLANPTAVTLDIEPELALIGDRATLARAVANLLTNAWKYTGAEKRIVLSARRDGKFVEIAVTDNGVGIGRREQVDIFEEFTRGAGAIDAGTAGVGLGLALVRAVARAHKGKVVVTSHPGEGSTFRLLLRRGILAEQAAPAMVPGTLQKR
jgi:two-component system, OmpR family, phosphate regulon sensor histidine kinase PhoR